MFNLVKGTHDIILDEASKYTYVEQILIAEAETFGYKEFRTPIIESSELFSRSVGDSSDIVRKEMYTFLDKGDRSITLRPEITAGTIRAMVNNKLFVNMDYPVKAYYLGPCFRYERPQQGRYRQFNQFGVECCGITSYLRDCEIISLGYTQLKLLGFKNLILKINYLGDEESRENYKVALREYFSKYLDQMCEDCHQRFNLNVLRILDCKDPSDQEIIKNAPKMEDYLNDSSKVTFKSILNQLDELEINYEIDSTLVRGLDYYSGVVFEFHYTSGLGKNYGAVGAGGHYNKLVKEIGGPDIEGCGFALGIERLVAVMSDDNLFKDLDDSLDIYVMPLDKNNETKALDITNHLRNFGYRCDICLENKNITQMFKKAERRKASYALILGDEEISSGIYKLKNIVTKEQIDVAKDNLIDKLDELFSLDEHDHH